MAELPPLQSLKTFFSAKLFSNFYFLWNTADIVLGHPVSLKEFSTGFRQRRGLYALRAVFCWEEAKLKFRRALVGLLYQIWQLCIKQHERI